MIFFDLVFYKAKPKQGQRCHFVKFPFQVLQISLTLWTQRIFEESRLVLFLPRGSGSRSENTLQKY